MTGAAGDDTLDELLAVWAASSRLDETEAEAVRAAVVGTPTGALDGLWWHELMAGVPALVIETAALPRAAQVALGRVGRPPEGPFSIPAA